MPGLSRAIQAIERSAELNIEFNPEDHTYRLDNQSVPSVTEVLESLDMYPAYPQAQREFYLARGTAVHLATQLYDAGKLKLVDSRLDGFLAAWKGFLGATGAVVRLVEHRVASSRFKYAGTTDRLMEIGGKPTIVDIKAGAPPKAAALQTAAYSLALAETEHIYAERRMAVHLAESGRFKVTEYTQAVDDERLFLAALAVWRWKSINT